SGVPLLNVRPLPRKPASFKRGRTPRWMTSMAATSADFVAMPGYQRTAVPLPVPRFLRPAPESRQCGPEGELPGASSPRSRGRPRLPGASQTPLTGHGELPGAFGDPDPVPRSNPKSPPRPRSADRNSPKSPNATEIG